MANLPLIIGGAVLAALLVAIALIRDIFRQRNSAAQEALGDIARLEQRERASRAQVTALEEQLAAQGAAFEKQAAELAEANTHGAQSDEVIAALEKQLAQEKQAGQDYRQTFDAQLADNDRLHADLARTVSEMTGRWQTLRAAATGETLKSEAADDSGTLAPSEPPSQDEAPVPDADVLDLKPEAMVDALPVPPEDSEPALAIF